MLASLTLSGSVAEASQNSRNFLTLRRHPPSALIQNEITLLQLRTPPSHETSISLH